MVFVHLFVLFNHIHSLLQLWKQSFPPPKAGRKSMVWAPCNQRDNTQELGGHSVPAAQKLLGAAAGARTTWKPALGAGAQSLHSLRGSRGGLASSASPKWNIELSSRSWRGCPRDGTCNQQQKMGKHLGAPVCPARVVLQVALSSTCGHTLGHWATCCTAFVPNTSLCLPPTCTTATGTPAHHVLLCQQYQGSSLEIQTWCAHCLNPQKKVFIISLNKEQNYAFV